MCPAKTTERESLYQPDRARKQMLKVLSSAATLLTQEIRFGCRLLEEAPDFAGDSNRYAARLLYRMLLGTLDGVEILLTSGSGDEARVLLRKAVEIVSQLQYLGLRQEDFLLGTAFMVEIAEEIAAQHRNKLEKLRAEWPRLFQQAEREMLRVKKQTHKRPVRWYSIRGGPVGIRQLVKATGHPLLLEAWEDLSRSVHGSNALESLERRIPELERRLRLGGLMLSPLRTSAQVSGKHLMFRADMLWTLGTLAMLFWEEQAGERLFLFNRNTRLKLIRPLVQEGFEDVDLICELQRAVGPEVT